MAEWVQNPEIDHNFLAWKARRQVVEYSEPVELKVMRGLRGSGYDAWLAWPSDYRRMAFDRRYVAFAS